jgi:hypothetical protein
MQLTKGQKFEWGAADPHGLHVGSAHRQSWPPSSGPKISLWAIGRSPEQEKEEAPLATYGKESSQGRHRMTECANKYKLGEPKERLVNDQDQEQDRML